MSTTTRRLSGREREHRREQDRQRLQQAAEQLLSSEGWQRWVRVRARGGLARLSLNNQLHIALANPEASYVCGFHSWLELGYQVKKGEKAIWILAPIRPKKREQENTEQEPERDRIFFRAVPVFDRQQVNPLEHGTPTPLEPPSQPLTGDSHAHLIGPLREFASRELGYDVQVETIAGSAAGWCDQKAKRIVLDGGLPANGQVRVLVHELAHALGVNYSTHTREQAEVIVDTAAYIVCASAGLDVSGETVPYIAGWGEDGALKAVQDAAATIDTIARRLEGALLEADPGRPERHDARQLLGIV